MGALQSRMPIGAAPRRASFADTELVRNLGPVIFLGLLALTMAAALTAQPAVAVAVPGLLLAALACTRWPAAATTVIIVCTAAQGTLSALTPIPPGKLSDLVLAGLWVGAIAAYVSGSARRTVRPWPPLGLAMLFLGLTFLMVFLAETVSVGFDGFKAAYWSMSALVLAAIAPWSRETHARIARGIAGAALVIGLYCLYRFFVGPSIEEQAANRAAQPGLPVSEQARFFGSWLSANQLASWTATVIPFLLVCALAWRGRWRLIAMGAIGLLALALFESDVRTGIAAVSVGIAIVFALFLVTPAFPGRLAAGIAAMLILLVVGAAGYAVTVGGDEERSTRFANLFNPSEDKAFTDRTQTWGAAIDDIAEHPWGHGLGTAGGAAVTNERTSEVSRYLDSTYIKVGLEQGWAAALLYIGTMLAVVLGLAWRSVRMVDRQRAMLAIGGAGALAALMVMFYAGLYSEGLPVMATWLIAGLGVAQLTVVDRPARREVAP